MGFPGQPYGQGRPDGRGVSESPGRPPGESVSGQPGEPGFPADPGYAGDAGHPAEAGAAQAGYQPASYQQTPGYPAGHDNRQWSGRVNGMAIAALVCGIAQFLLWFFLLVPGFIVALMALIFGLAGLAQIKRRGESGKGMAITGIVLGGLGVLSGVVWGVLFAAGTSHFHYHNY